MSQTHERESIDRRVWRWAIVGAIVLLVFFTTYQLATAGSQVPTAEDGRVATQAGYAGDGTNAAAADGGCECCGTSSDGPVEGFTTDAGGVQVVEVDVTDGFAPNVIRATAGVPMEITFGQGSGCMAEVMSADLDFYEDLQSGPRTIALPALEAGEYGFSCGMQMVFGAIIVE
jgi:hypothetical protein